MANKQDVTYKKFIDISKIVSIVFTNLEYGRGIYFETDDKDLNKLWLALNKKNNINSIIWRLLYEKNKYGNQVLKFDLINKKEKDVRLIIPNFNNLRITNAYETDMILMEIENHPITVSGSVNLDYLIRENWNKKSYRLTFFYQNKQLTFAEFLTEIPDEYQKDKIKSLFNVKEYKLNKSKINYEIKNPFDDIPAVLFSTPTQKQLLENEKSFSDLLDRLFSEMINDVVYSRPFTNYVTNNKNLTDYFKKHGAQPPIDVSTNSVSRDDKYTTLAPKERLSVLTAAIEKTISFAFNQANTSYIKQLASVPSNSNDLANSAGSRNSDVARMKSNYLLKIFFNKIFKFFELGNKKFKIYLLEADQSKELQIKNIAEQVAMNLISKEQAKKQLNVEENTTESKIAKENKKPIETNVASSISEQVAKPEQAAKPEQSKTKEETKDNVS